MEKSDPHEDRARRQQRGFTLLETILSVAILSMLVLATASAFGTRPPRAHPAELALQAALVEARGIAASTGNAADPLVPTGATVTVANDPRDATGYSSIIRVFRSRPIRYSGPGRGSGSDPLPLLPDVGFPTVRVGATFRLTDTNPNDPPTSDRPFTILISHAGYVSVLRGYLYDPASNNIFTQGDPGCTDGGVTIVADDRTRQEIAPLSCREGILQMKDAADAL